MFHFSAVGGIFYMTSLQGSGGFRLGDGLLFFRTLFPKYLAREIAQFGIAPWDVEDRNDLFFLFIIAMLFVNRFLDGVEANLAPTLEHW